MHFSCAHVELEFVSSELPIKCCFSFCEDADSVPRSISLTWEFDQAPTASRWDVSNGVPESLALGVSTPARRKGHCATWRLANKHEGRPRGTAEMVVVLLAFLQTKGNFKKARYVS